MAIKAPRVRGQSASLTSPMSYAGQNISAPAPVQSKPIVAGSIQSAIDSAQAGQNAANTANNQRYTQGLGVLSNTGTQANQFAAQGQQQLGAGEQSAQGFIQNAIANNAGFGTAARQRVQQGLQNAQGSTAQSAVSRGIGNTTVLDALQRGNARDAEQQNQAIDEAAANRASALNLQQANTATTFAGQKANQSNAQGNAARTGGNDIASFIANRNDVAPNLGEYANLVQGAAQGGPGKMTGTTINAPASYTGGLGRGGFASGGGSGGQSGGFQGGAGGAVSGGSFGSGGYSGPGTGSSAGGNGPSSGPIASAINPQGTTYNNPGATTVTPLPDAGAASPIASSMSMSQGSNNPAALAGQPYAGQTKSWTEMSGLSPSVVQNFINGGGKITG
jgi:hypothetical protein